MIFILRKMLLVFILIFFYAAFFWILFISYKLHSSTGAWRSSYEAVAEVGFFLVAFIFFNGIDRWIGCFFAILIFAVSAGGVHLYFSEIYGAVDWQGISGAMNVIAIQAILSTYIFLMTVAFVWVMRFFIKQFSTCMGRS